MNEDVKYSGFAAVPADYECPDGQLAASENCLYENGALVPLLPPAPLFTLPDKARILYIHKTSTSINYIGIGRGFLNFSYLVYYTEKFSGQSDNSAGAGKSVPSAVNDESDQSSDSVDSDGEVGGNQVSDTLPGFGNILYSEIKICQMAASGIKQISSVGNTLIVATANSLRYFLFKGKHYYDLGELPSIELGFALEGHAELRSYAVNTIALQDGNTVTPDDQYILIHSEYVKAPADNCIPSGSGGHSDLNNHIHILNTSLKLKANKEYYWEQTNEFTAADHWSELYGTKEGDSSPSLIATLKKGKRKYFVANANYSNLYFLIWTTYDNKFTYRIPVPGLTYFYESQGTIAYSVVKHTQENLNSLLAVNNKFVAEQSTLKNRFLFPFFIRYALRLYDDSPAYVSPPVLIVPNFGYSPLVLFNNNDFSRAYVAGVCSELVMQVRSAVNTDWDDIIQSVDIYVSQPIYTYNQGIEYSVEEYPYRCFGKNAAVNDFRDLARFNCVLNLASSQAAPGGSVADIFEEQFKLAQITPGAEAWTAIQTASLSKDELTKNITKESKFYKIKSFTLKEISSYYVEAPDAVREWHPVELEDGTLKTLLARPPLSQEYTQWRFKNASLHVYNNRLHVFDVDVVYPAVANPAFQQTATAIIVSGERANIDAWVWIKTESGDCMVHQEFTCPTNINLFSWFYYPNPNAYRAVIAYTVNEQTFYADLKLEKHDFLNGAYFFSGDTAKSFISKGTVNSRPDFSEAPDSRHVDKAIYVSNAGNPFAFDSACVVSVPSALHALSSAAKALSQGQFGQFPLYAFTDEGVWALAISDTGTYSARQPITRDVCLSAESIAQLDSSVVFASARGLMMLSGSNASCISQPLNSQYPFNVLSLPGFSRLHDIIHSNAGSCYPLLPFTEFLKSCRIIYDYTHQRLYIAAPKIPYAYAYSLSSGQWGFTSLSLMNPLNSYPDSLAVVFDENEKRNLVDFAHAYTPEEAPVTGAVYVTRPLKLGDGNTLKTVSTVIQRGDFARGHVATVLYGSRDLLHWYRIWSSTDHYLRGFSGTPWKYFRIAGVAKLNPDESISAATVQFTPRLTNRLR